MDMRICISGSLFEEVCMKLKLIDALDVMGMGGYIDLQTMEYIHPQWYTRKFEKERGLTSEDYERFSKTPERYLKPPLLRGTPLACMTALQMGVPRDKLVEMGFCKEDFGEIFCYDRPLEKEDAYECTDAERRARKALDNYMRSTGKYFAFLTKKSENTQAIVRKWFEEQGIELCE